MHSFLLTSREFKKIPDSQVKEANTLIYKDTILFY